MFAGKLQLFWSCSGGVCTTPPAHIAFAPCESLATIPGGVVAGDASRASCARLTESARLVLAGPVQLGHNRATSADQAGVRFPTCACASSPHAHAHALPPCTR
eukprot:6462421-Prymnesium_polylepis.1